MTFSAASSTTSSARSLARRERLALCDSALAAGPDAPTLCDPWDARHLIAHLVLRERSPRALGISVKPLAGVAERGMERLAGKDFQSLVERFRSPGPVPMAWPGVEQVLNTLEHLVHHEDLRRAQAGWKPRPLDPADEHTIWSYVGLFGRGIVRRAKVPVRIAWDGRETTLRRGDDPVVLSGRPTELALLLHGRGAAAQVDLEGPPDRVAAFTGADLSV